MRTLALVDRLADWLYGVRYFGPWSNLRWRVFCRWLGRPIPRWLCPRFCATVEFADGYASHYCWTPLGAALWLRRRYPPWLGHERSIEFR